MGVGEGAGGCGLDVLDVCACTQRSAFGSPRTPSRSQWINHRCTCVHCPSPHHDHPPAIMRPPLHNPQPYPCPHSDPQAPALTPHAPASSPWAECKGSLAQADSTPARTFFPSPLLTPQLEANGRWFSAGSLQQHTLAPLNPSAAVALLQLAQGLMDAAAAVRLPPSYQPLPLQVGGRGERWACSPAARVCPCVWVDEGGDRTHTRTHARTHARMQTHMRAHTCTRTRPLAAAAALRPRSPSRLCP